MEEKITRLTDHFGVNLALILSDKISSVHKNFDKKIFAKTVKQNCAEKSLTHRVEFIADCLKEQSE